MNKQRSTFQQFVMFAALAWFATSIFNQFFGPKTDAPAGPAKPAPTLAQAFAGIDPKTPQLDAQGAAAELKKLDAGIAANKTDEHSYWARLRAGLIEQYLLKKPDAAIKRYTEIVNQHSTDAIHAQAVYQKGDLQWNQVTAAPPGAPQVAAPPNAAVSDSAPVMPLKTAAHSLEQTITYGRASSQYLDHQIMVPARGVSVVAPGTVVETGATSASIAANAANAPPNFALKRVGDIRGTWDKPDPQGILERVNYYYSTTPFYKIFDGSVKILGDNPAWSYGLAILIFATFTRILIQPINKKQYDSMKGMQIIAPEMKKIQTKYEKRKDQQSQAAMVGEIRDLQKRHGVNPMLGCGLAILQIPLFLFVVSPFIQHFEAKMQLIGAGFLWIENLAQPDIPLLVLYAISQFLSIRLSSTAPTDAQQRQMQIMMTFVFPFLAPIFLLSWPSAFTLYWMMFNILSTFFQYRMMKAADPQKTFIKSLITMPSIDSEAADAALNEKEGKSAIPARPTGEKVRPKTVALSQETGINGKNGADKNGVSSGEIPLNGNSPGTSANGSSANGNGASNGASGNGKSGKGAKNQARRRRR